MNSVAKHSVPGGSFVLDSEGLEQAAQEHSRQFSVADRRIRDKRAAVVSCATIAEVLHGTPRDAVLRAHLKSVILEPVDAEIAVKAAELLAKAPRRGKEKSRTVDAIVCATAILRAPKPALILSSDPEDLKALLGEARGVEVVRV